MHISQNYYFVFPQLQHIVKLYQELEQITSNVSNLFAVKCPDGCGECCNTSCSNIEATITEMLPLCVYLYEKNTYQMWLDKAGQERCLFYETALNHKKGCCAVYEYRPLVCRLFGYSFTKNKYGAIVPVACPTLKKQYTAKKEIIPTHSDALPQMSSISMQSMMIDPTRGERYSINEAFVKAMEYVMLKMRIVHNNSGFDKIA